MTGMPKTWFVSYRRASRAVRSGHARTTDNFESEAEAKSFARTLPAQGSDPNAGTINPLMPKQFFGSAKIKDWLAEPAEDATRAG
jgi:hypothetical protein